MSTVPHCISAVPRLVSTLPQFISTVSAYFDRMSVHLDCASLLPPLSGDSGRLSPAAPHRADLFPPAGGGGRVGRGGGGPLRSSFSPHRDQGHVSTGSRWSRAAAIAAAGIDSLVQAIATGSHSHETGSHWKATSSHSQATGSHSQATGSHSQATGSHSQASSYKPPESSDQATGACKRLPVPCDMLHILGIQ